MKKEVNKHTELLWTIALALVIPVWIGVSPNWYSWYEKSTNGIFLKQTCELLDGLWLINIPICIILGYFTYIWCQRILKDNDIRWFRFILAILGLIFIYVNCQVDYARIVWKFDYKLFLTLLLLISLLVMLAKIIVNPMPNRMKRILSIKANRVFISFRRVLNRIRRSLNRIRRNGPIKNKKMTTNCNLIYPKVLEKEKDKEAGFPDDSVANETIPENIKNYASIIVDKLLATKIDNHSFAVGITGRWGEGKTTFLDLLKKRIKSKAEVVEFNPWMCLTPEQVIQDFFSSLRHQLSPKYSTLSKSIKEYAKLVGNTSLSPNNVFGINMTVPLGKDSLFEKKKNLSEKFSHLPRPVVVFIDDVDRLEREEVFEVLRLIRNTADLSNTIYIVAYDREYVTFVLEEKNIKDASLFLEKIFPIEVHLPKVEDKLIWDTLKADFVKQDNKYSGDFAKALFAKFTHEQRELILRVLNNYRHAKRFARLYMLNFSYLNKQFPREIDLIDLFWLELLQIYDPKTFDKLANDPSCLLYYDVNKERYILRNGIKWGASDKDMEAYKGKPFWNENTPSILELMFSRFTQSNKKKSISMTENYEKYFIMSISPFKLSIKEMNELFSKGANPEELVCKWMNEKYSSSIAYQMKQIEVNRLQENDLQAFLQGLLCFGEKLASKNIHFLRTRIIALFQKKRYNTSSEKIAHNIVLTWIERKITEGNTLLNLSMFLNKLYMYKSYDQNGQAIKPTQLVISNEEVTDALVNMIKSYLEKHSELTALDILNEKGELGKLFNNCCVLVEDASSLGNYNTHLQVAFDTVIDHFAKKEIKPTQEDFSHAFDSMFQRGTPEFDTIQWEDDEDDYWYPDEYQSEEMIDSYFGSDNSKFEDFKARCFYSSPLVADNKIKEKDG